MVGYGPQGVSQHIRHTDRLEKQRLELWKDWRLPIRSEVDLPALDGPPEEAGARQESEFSLNRALPDTRVANDLAQIESLRRMPEQPPQHTTPRAAEKHGGGFRTSGPSAVGCRTHCEYIRTRIGYDCQAWEVTATLGRTQPPVPASLPAGPN
jgi:hypothetical protein